jgi:hypothetical protein
VIGSAPVALARLRDWPYLNVAFPRTAPGRIAGACSVDWSRMAQPVSTPQDMPGALRPARKLAPAIAVGGVGLGAAILAGALVLWFRYGTAVFFEMVASGISACF